MRCTVTSTTTSTTGESIQVQLPGCKLWLSVEEIHEHHPKPREIKTGDMVTLGDGIVAGRVLHVHGGQAWVEHVGLRSVGCLRHVDAEA